MKQNKIKEMINMKLGTLLDQLDVREVLDNIEIDDIYYIDDSDDLEFVRGEARDGREKCEALIKQLNDALSEAGSSLDPITFEDVVASLITALTLGEA